MPVNSCGPPHHGKFTVCSQAVGIYVPTFMLSDVWSIQSETAWIQFLRKGQHTWAMPQGKIYQWPFQHYNSWLSSLKHPKNTVRHGSNLIHSPHWGQRFLSFLVSQQIHTYIITIIVTQFRMHHSNTKYTSLNTKYFPILVYALSEDNFCRNYMHCWHQEKIKKMRHAIKVSVIFISIYRYIWTFI